MDEAAVKAAAGRVSEALQKILDNEGDFLVETNEVCHGFEELCMAVGVSYLHVAKLRRELRKRGLR